MLPDESMKLQLQAIVLQHHPAHGDYVRLYDIPAPWRDAFFAYARQREPAELPYIWSEEGPHERAWLWHEWLAEVMQQGVVPACAIEVQLDEAYLRQWQAQRAEAQAARRNMCVLRPRGR